MDVNVVMVSRQAVVTEARRWINTPFQHQGRLLSRGVDCVGMVLCVMRDLGLGDWLGEYAVYPAQPVDSPVLRVCRERLTEKPIQEREPGDVLAMRMPVSVCHAAIVTERGIIHAYAGVGRVFEHKLNAKWLRRVAGCYAIPGVE